LTTSRTIELIYDADDSIYVTDAMYVFSLLPEHDPWACLAILQSKLLLFLYRVSNQGESRVIPQVKASKLQSLPYPICNSEHPLVVELSQRCKTIQELHKQLKAARTDQDRTIIQRRIDATDARIDALCYELYSLTAEEIRIVEAATQ
jgi:hypothetical protein